MSKTISISTKKGDSGESFLANGKKYQKDNIVFEVLGTIDELNSHIGLAVAQLRNLEALFTLELITELQIMQSNLYKLSGIIAGAKITLSKKELTHIEKLGDQLQTKMANGWTTQFLYPGGSVIGAQLDVARTVCRRVERLIVTFSKDQKQEPIIAKYINRLSDTLFIIRCYVNMESGIAEKKFSK